MTSPALLQYKMARESRDQFRHLVQFSLNVSTISRRSSKCDVVGLVHTIGNKSIVWSQMRADIQATSFSQHQKGKEPFQGFLDQGCVTVIELLQDHERSSSNFVLSKVFDERLSLRCEG